MRILWVATKPPWPPFDGGRLLMWNTLGGLAALGHGVTLVAPTLGLGARELGELEARLAERCEPSLVRARLRPPLLDAAGATWARRPWTLHRHALPAVRHRVAELLRGGGWDAVHVEQVQAMAAVRDLAPTSPVVLRAQNVESDLWRAQADGRPAPVAAWFRHQARALARAEGRAVTQARATAALTPEDGARLEGLAAAVASSTAAATRSAEVRVVPAPFETELPAGEGSLEGSPPLVIFGSAGWRPNRTGAEWFVREVWPSIRSARPRARLHLFGDGVSLGPSSGPGLVRHRAPASSQEALRMGSVLVVPLHVASGVRMKILEAWARGIPVIATPTAARGLGATHGRELLLADDAGGFVEAVGAVGHPETRRSLVEAARARLREHHASETVARRLVEVYGEAGQ